MTSTYRRDHQGNVPGNDEIHLLNSSGMAVVNNAAAFFEGLADNENTPPVPEGERLALKRAMCRFLTDSGIASARGWV